MRKFPATIRTASNKKTTDSVIPSTWREGTEYGVYEEDLLFALVPVDSFIIFLYEVIAFFFFLMCPGLEKVSLGVGKTEDI